MKSNAPSDGGTHGTASAAQRIAAHEAAKTRAHLIIGTQLRKVAMELVRYGIDEDVIAIAMIQAARDAAAHASACIAEDERCYDEAVARGYGR